MPTLRVIVTTLLAIAAITVYADRAPLAADEGPQRVTVVNFPEVQRVDGTVTVSAPIPQTRLAVVEALVSPGGRRDEPGSYTDAGILDTAGFASVSISLAGEVQGRLGSPAPITVVLLPDVRKVVATFHDHGITPFALTAEAEAAPTEPGLFHSEPAHFRLGFPRYRVLLYNGSPHTIRATVYAYLNNA